MAAPITQQAGTGLGVVGDGKGWSGGSTRPDGEANQPQAIKEKRPKCFLEVELNKKKLGRIVLELFGDVVPRTVENFRCLCTGEKGLSAVSGKPLHFKGSRLHKIIPGRLIQGGDITRGDGTGGDSIYNQDGDGTFPSESFKLKHDKPGLISMAHKRSEEGCNSSQFFFPSKAEPKMDGKHVVFGRVIEGIDKLSKIESMGSKGGTPLYEVVISDCGELESECMRSRKRKADETSLPTGWEKKESRSKPGLIYYQHESGATQFERPSSRGKDPLAGALENEKRRKMEESKKQAEKLPDRAVMKGECRIWHILKKHRDFFGKPAKSWRQKNITWSKKEAKDALVAIKNKLFNVGYGGGTQALQKKFENYARQESDDDVSAKVGGDLGPITKKKKLFGGYDLAKVAFETKIGEMSDIVESTEGVHLLGRFE